MGSTAGEEAAFFGQRPAPLVIDIVSIAETLAYLSALDRRLP